MFLKRVLNQPNLVGTVLIALMVCTGFVYAFAFDGFNVETATGSEVETWLEQVNEVSYGGPCKCGRNGCPKLSCFGCGAYNCAVPICGGSNKCNCPDRCTSTTGKGCYTKNGVCGKNPPTNPPNP